MTATSQQILEKYWHIIAEEVNVKKVTLIQDTSGVVLQYLPNGRELWSDFGKDTGMIIWAAKSGNAVLNTDETLTVTWPAGQERILQSHQFEVRYTWFDGPNQVVESGAMIELDLESDQALIDEWVAREISRFLNQMRKDADFDVSDRVDLAYASQSDYLTGIISQYKPYLEAEALLSSIKEWIVQDCDHTSTFEYEWESIVFAVKK